MARVFDSGADWRRYAADFERALEKWATGSAVRDACDPRKTFA